ncbi:hypothetical protein FACS1894151_11360 [Spirochaetia bacterium]|nr:hypothetical protein FACS1894151_11360 [Spirochaetia bacterium]
MPGKFETLFAYRFEEYTKAEQLIHGIFNKYRENGEWFNLNQKQLDLIKANCEEMGGILVSDEFEKGMETELLTDDSISRQYNDISNSLTKTQYKNDNQNKILEFNNRCIIIKIHQETVDNNNGLVYEAVRHCWKNKKANAERADYVLAVVQGLVVGVFKPTKWYYPDMEFCKKICGGRTCKYPRIAFIGDEADTDIQNMYLNKYIPAWYMRPGPGPVQFTYK